MKGPLRVLLIEDSEDDALLVMRALARAGWDPVCKRVETEGALRAALRDSTFDLIVADWALPGFSGMAALAVAQAEAADVPFIICSGKVEEEMVVSALRAGAKDFVTRRSFGRLAPAVERELSASAMRRERRRAEDEVRHIHAERARAQRFEEVGAIASHVAHEVGNLLTPLLLYPDQIKRRLEADHPARQLCDRMTQGLHRLAGVTQDLLALGRRGPLPLEPADLNGLVRQALDSMGELPPTLRLQLLLAPELPCVAASGAQLAQTVMNLCTNAREAMNDCGVLTVKTSAVELSAPQGLLRAGRYASIEVADTGCGIPPDQLDRIFEPFFTTKSSDGHSGSGLGLAIVQAIVAEHHGAVSVASDVGRGTRFTVSIPAM